MDDYSNIIGKSTIISTASSINKVIKAMVENKTKTNGGPGNEIELLKKLCKSDNPQTAQIAVQALIQLVRSGSLDLGQVLSILVTTLTGSSSAHFAAISNGMFELLLLDLRRRCAALGESKYVCPFDIKSPQHPLILLLDNQNVANMLCFSAKIHEICQHHDQLIRKNSIEFLKPVFLYIFCNISTFPESLKIWRTLLKCCDTGNEMALSLVYDILFWSKTSTSEKVLFTNSLLLEALDVLPSDKQFDSLRGDLCLYLAAVTKEMVSFNFDPSGNFLQILSVLHTLRSSKSLNYSILLMVLADLLQSLTPAYVLGLLRVVRFLLDKGCNRLSQLMVLDGTVQLLGQQTFIDSYLGHCDNILQIVLSTNSRNTIEETNANQMAIYFHRDLAKYQQFHRWWSLVESGKISVDSSLDNATVNQRFFEQNNLILRGLFYEKELSSTSWEKVFELLIGMSKADEKIGSRIRMPILFTLANDTSPKKRMLLLQSLASMGAKDHVLGVLKALTKDVDRATSLSLYLRLWKAEPRTYPFLYEILKDTSRRPKEDPWETTFARIYTIREICLIKPQQHGADLVNLFSEILSHPEDANNEAAVALALDAIASLCENDVVNIVSTWKVLGFKFTHERRPRIIRSLCKFFTNVPSIQLNSIEQEKLVNDIVGKLWHFVTDFDEREVIVAALDALKAFPPEIMNIFQIPEIFRQGIILPTEDDDTLDAKQIPGECWVNLMQYVNHSAIEEAGDLVAHHIRNEMKSYRGGIYLTPAGRPEPSTLRYLPNKSILAAVVHCLISQKIKQSSGSNSLFLYNLLRILAKKLPKPIPPLDWCFLHEYIHNCFEMKKYCLLIAIKQMPHSGTAKRLVENYLSEMIEIDMSADDVLVIFESLDIVTESVQTDIYKRFVHLGLQCLLECSEGNELKGPDPFAKTVQYLKLTFSKKYQNEENFEYLCETMENLFSRFTVKTSIFQEYIQILCLLPQKYVCSLLKPSTWVDKRNILKLEKVIQLQFSIHKYNQTATDMHLLGLSDILKAVSRLDAENERVQRYFLHSFLNFVTSLENHKSLNNWIIELIGYIQTELIEKQLTPLVEVLFMVDVFMIVVTGLSGYVSLLSTDAIVACLDERLSIFPPCLVMLFNQNLLRDIENKIYEFLYHLHNHSGIPRSYAGCFEKAIICCKEQSYFQQPQLWSKFVSLRRAS
ncbi:focadhesin [Topomyia yanbarensis]|uniref:focadhesin n=1 Tax=Topomyia yanbarensis TaxID=2498891 RepID=UPI00273AE48B|nr:focadhesin [Topomyia yanbarensis]